MAMINPVCTQGSVHLAVPSESLIMFETTTDESLFKIFFGS
jgi:hypothetical protein